MKKIKILLLIITISMFSFISGVSAIPLKKVMFVGENMKVSKEVDGTMFLAGNTVNAKNSINGMSFIAGNTINVSSKQDYLFLAGNTISLKNAKFKDGFICGNLLSINKSNIERDLYVAGNVININSNIGRNLSVAGSKVTINSEISGDLYIASEKIVITKNAKINGTLKYNENAEIKIAKDSIIDKQETYVSKEKENSFMSDLFSRFESFVNMLLVGIILLFIFKNSFKKLSKQDINFSEILKNLGIGFLVLLAVPILCLITMITIIGVSVSIIVGGMYILFIYISTIFSTYYISNKLLKEKIKNEYTILMIGLFCVFLLKLVPVIGSMLTLFILFLGLGLITNLIVSYIKSNK